MAKELNSGKGKMPYTNKGEAVGAEEKKSKKPKKVSGLTKPPQKL